MHRIVASVGALVVIIVLSGAKYAEAQMACESVSNYTQCSSDLSCSYNTARKTCHTRENLPKCEDLAEYLCFGRGDCTATIPTAPPYQSRCVRRVHHKKFDEVPQEAIAAKLVCAAIKSSDECYRNFWCQYDNDGKTQRCTTRHSPRGDVKIAQPKPGKSKSAAEAANSCPQGGCTYVTIGKNARAFHIKWAGARVALDPPVGDIRITRLATDRGVLDEMFPNGDMPNVEVRRATGIKNAIAVVYRGKRHIIHDPMWSNGSDVEAGGIMVSQIVLGHELGHHICKHSPDAGFEGQKERELEADRVAGSILGKIGNEKPGSNGSLDHVLHAARQLFKQEASPSHPGVSERIAAIAEGFRNGHTCHNRR